MLLENCRNAKVKSIFVCDKCGKQVSKDGHKGIYVTNDNGRPVKEFDLCLDCYGFLGSVIHNEGDDCQC